MKILNKKAKDFYYSHALGKKTVPGKLSRLVKLYEN